MPLVPTSDIERLSNAAMLRHGAAEPVAAEMARAIAWAEARDNRICGLYYLESYCLQLGTGRVDGTATPVVTLPRPAEVRVDAAHGFAQSAFAAALPRATEAARANGVAVMAIHNAHTCTADQCFAHRGRAGRQNACSGHQPDVLCRAGRAGRCCDAV
jgi:(2R)-3-sulfolactate dehydrogenase (NADP+)